MHFHQEAACGPLVYISHPTKAGPIICNKFTTSFLKREASIKLWHCNVAFYYHLEFRNERKHAIDW